MHITEGKLPAAVQRICANDLYPALDHGLMAFRLHAQHKSAALVVSQKTCSVHVSLEYSNYSICKRSSERHSPRLQDFPLEPFLWLDASCNLVPLCGAHLCTWLRHCCSRIISAGALRTHRESSRRCCDVEGMRSFTTEALNVEGMYCGVMCTCGPWGILLGADQRFMEPCNRRAILFLPGLFGQLGLACEHKPAAPFYGDDRDGERRLSFLTDCDGESRCRHFSTFSKALLMTSACTFESKCTRPI